MRYKNDRRTRKQAAPLTSSKTVFVQNLPLSTSDKELTKVFSQFGHVVKCFTVENGDKLVKGNPRKSTKFAFVTFSNDDEVTRATNRKLVKLKEHTLLCLPAKRRIRQQIKSSRRDESNAELFDEEIDNLASFPHNPHTSNAQSYHSSSDSASEKEEAEEKPGPKKELGIQARSLVMSGLPNSQSVGRYCDIIKRLVGQYISGLETIEPQPQLDNTLLLTFSSKQLARSALTLLNNLSWGEGALAVGLASLALLDPSAKHQKKSKLLVRNLSFKCGIEELKKSFEKFGKVVEAHIPQKPGTEQMLGFGFVTMSNVFEASAALSKMNGSEIKGRKVAVDWALDRKTYSSQKQQQQQQQQQQPQQQQDPVSSDDVASQSEADPSETESDGISEQMDSEQTADTSSPKPRKVDSTDGKCLFMRNLPFSLDEEDLTEYFSDQFGAVQYAKLVTNHETGMLTGNGFVRFREESTAEDCLKQSEQGISIEGRTIEVMRAVTKEEASVLTGKRNVHKKEDRRNLKMSKIGSLDAESEAFSQLPKADQVKRARAEAEKKEKLNNPNIFVSKDRLSIRNLPISMGDKELKALSARFLPKGSKVTSAKVMRDMNRLEKGVGRSKGFGFVGFSSHEAAMTVLNALNNNPDVLSNKRRLIVELSLENQRAIKVKESRLSKSKLQIQRLNEAKDSNATNAGKDKPKKLNKSGIGKAMVRKGKIQPSRMLGGKAKGKNKDTIGEEGTKTNKINQKSPNNSDLAQPKKETKKLKKSKKIPGPSRRERKRGLGERELGDEKQFEELVRQYRKKLFKIST